MLELSIWELFFRTIPEGFAFMLAAYVFARKDIEKNKYILSSILLGAIIYLFRKLPIHFGVHTILLIMVYSLLAVTINKIEIKKAVSAALSSTILMFLSEGLNVILLDKLFNIKIEDFVNIVSLKLLYSSPSLIFFAIIVFVFYKVSNRTKRG